MKVIAIAEGYDGLVVRSPDAFDGHGKPIVFDVPDGVFGRWYRPVDAKGNLVECDDKGRPIEVKKTKAEAKKAEGSDDLA